MSPRSEKHHLHLTAREKKKNIGNGKQKTKRKKKMVTPLWCETEVRRDKQRGVGWQTPDTLNKITYRK